MIIVQDYCLFVFSKINIILFLLLRVALYGLVTLSWRMGSLVSERS